MEIQHMEEYLVHDSGIFLKISLILYLQSDVTTATANVLDIAALIDPSKIVSKIKYHLLLHLREDIIRFGPLVGVATEVFECFNAIFWYCSILSNHLAPSRDITYKLAAQETMKHFLLGSWWPSKSATSGNIWVRPGPSVCNFIASNPILHSLCGWTRDEGLVPGLISLACERQNSHYNPDTGTVKSEPRKQGVNHRLLPQVHLSWLETKGSQSINNILPHPESQWQ
jgi:hypothetical protein